MVVPGVLDILRGLKVTDVLRVLGVLGVPGVLRVVGTGLEYYFYPMPFRFKVPFSGVKGNLSKVQLYIPKW